MTTKPLQEIDTNVTLEINVNVKYWSLEEDSFGKGLSNAIQDLHSNQVSIVTWALENLHYNFTCNFCALRQLFVDLGGHTATLSAIQKHSHDQDIQSLGFWLLWITLQDSWERVTFEVTEALIRFNVIESTVTAMKRFHSDKGLVSSAIMILRILSENASKGMKRNLVLANVIESIVAAMKHCRSDTSVVSDGLDTLANALSKNSFCHIVATDVVVHDLAAASFLVNELDAASFLVDLMTEYRDDPCLILTGFRLLKGLAEIKELRGKLVESGAIRGLSIVFEALNDGIIKQKARDIISTLMDYQICLDIVFG